MPLAHEQETLVVLGKQPGVAVSFYNLLLLPEKLRNLNALHSTGRFLVCWSSDAYSTALRKQHLEPRLSSNANARGGRERPLAAQGAS